MNCTTPAQKTAKSMGKKEQITRNCGGGFPNILQKRVDFVPDKT